MSTTESAPSRAGPLRVVARRVDWRFLLPDPAPERVALIGRADDALGEALAALCGAPVRHERAPDGADTEARFDLVVLVAGGTEDARCAARLVAPGGTLRWETRGHPGARAARAALVEAGMEDVALHWYRPTFDAALEAIPLDAPGILDHVLRGGTHGLAGESRRVAARVLRRLGLLELVARSRGFTARRGPPTSDGFPGRLRRLAAERGGGSPERARLLLRTPRFRASGHVLLFAFPENSSIPALLAKVARVPGPADSLRREAGSLEALATLRGSRVEGVPGLIERTDAAGSEAVLQTFVPGVPVHPDHVRRDPERCIGPFVDWIADLHQRTRAVADAVAWRDEAVEAPLRRIEALFGPSAPEAALAARTREIVAPLGAAAAWVFEHGDFSAPNLLLDADRAGVVDWEMGTPHGVAATDLFVLLGFAARARARASTPAAARDAARSAFFGATPWAAPWVRRYAERAGVPAADLPARYVLAWARNVAGYVERLQADAAPGASAEDLRAWLRREPCCGAWEDAVRHFDALRPGGLGDGT